MSPDGARIAGCYGSTSYFYLRRFIRSSKVALVGPLGTSRRILPASYGLGRMGSMAEVNRTDDLTMKSLGRSSEGD